MRLDGIDVVGGLLQILGGEHLNTREHGDVVVHAYRVPDLAAPVLVGGPVPGDHRGGECWVGADVGRYVISPTFYDALAQAYTEDLTALPGAIRDGTVRLWVTRPVDPARLSVEDLRSTAYGCVARAGSVAARLADPETDDEARPRVDWQAWLEAPRLDFERGGHHGRRFRPGAFIGEQVGEVSNLGRVIFERDHRGAWHIGASAWPAPFHRPLTEVRSWIEAQYPPDYLWLSPQGEQIRAIGALGIAAFAIEDTYDVTRAVERLLRPYAVDTTLLSEVFGSMLGYRKLEILAERFMPRGELGWLRPFTFTGSVPTGTAEVSVWDRERAEMVTDAALTAVFTEVVRDPEDREARKAVLDLSQERFNRMQGFQS